jgi:hypothetical protein
MYNRRRSSRKVHSFASAIFHRTYSMMLWVVQSILAEQQVKHRAKVYELFVRVAYVRFKSRTLHMLYNAYAEYLL